MFSVRAGTGMRLTLHSNNFSLASESSFQRSQHLYVNGNLGLTIGWDWIYCKVTNK